jgi:hypothetical protein
MTDHTCVFDAIKNFALDLSTIFGDQLKLYCHLIKQTNIEHTAAVNKHVEAFKLFCNENSEHILTKNKDGITNGKIIYSEKVFIDISDIIETCPKDDLPSIWTHLIYIHALLIPTNGAKEILSTTMEPSEFTGSLPGILGDVISKLTSVMDKESDEKGDIMTTFANVVGSEDFREIVNDLSKSMSNGDIDIASLLGDLGGLSGGLSGGEGGNPMMNMMSTLMSSMGNLPK